MTLVVARRLNHCIAIVGDTSTTQNEAQNRIATVKTAVLSGSTTLSFSGSPELANLAARMLLDTGASSFNAVRDVLLPIHKDSDETSEFIFTSEDRIFAVRNGRVRAVSDAWIGDYQGYRTLRSKELGRVRSPPNAPGIEALMLLPGNSSGNTVEKSSSMIIGMRFAIESMEVNTVGGIPVLITNRDGEYKYECHTQLLYGRSFVRPDGTTAMADGEFSTHHFSLGATTDSRDDPIIVAYYGAGKVAYVLRRTEDNQFPSISAVEADIDPTRASAEIRERTRADFEMMEMVHQRP